MRYICKYFWDKNASHLKGSMEKDPDRWHDSPHKLLSASFKEECRIGQEIKDYFRLSSMHPFICAYDYLWYQQGVYLWKQYLHLKQSWSGGNTNLKALVKSHLQELIWMCGIYHQSCKSINPCCGLQHWEFAVHISVPKWRLWISVSQIHWLLFIQVMRHLSLQIMQIMFTVQWYILSSKSYKHY